MNLTVVIDGIRYVPFMYDNLTGVIVNNILLEVEKVRLQWCVLSGLLLCSVKWIDGVRIRI